MTVTIHVPLSEQGLEASRLYELLCLRTFTQPDAVTGRKVTYYKTLSDFPGLRTQSLRHQYRQELITGNLSNPVKPASPVKPKSVQAKRSARVRSYDDPTELGSTHARFIDPSGNAFKARHIKGRTNKKGKLVISDYRFTDGPTAFDGRMYPVVPPKPVSPLYGLSRADLRDLYTRVPIQSRKTKTIRLSGCLPYLQPCKGTRLVSKAA